MKRKFGLLLAAVSLFTLTSCGFLEGIREQIGGDKPLPTVPSTQPNNNENESDQEELTEPENPGVFTITYDFNNGSVKSIKTTSDNYAIKPKNPVKIAATFSCWCSDEELNKPFDFNTKIIRNTTLYAKYEIDYAALTNELSTDEIKGTIRVISKFSKGIKVQQSLGSGTIIKEDPTYYYALTNNHVIYVPTGFKKESYTVIDCFLQEHDMWVMASSADYDLALIKFKKESNTSKQIHDLPVIRLANDNLSKNEAVIAVGNPLGQSNVITYGNSLGSNNVFQPNPDTIAESNVRFPVINHTAFIDSGSSGGALFDTNLHLIGVNFASSTTIDEGKFMYSHAIPLDKVKEFLKEANFTI